MLVQSSHFRGHRRLACFSINRSSIVKVHLLKQKSIEYVRRLMIFLSLRSSHLVKAHVQDAVTTKIVIKLNHIINSNIYLFRNNWRSTFWKTASSSKPSTTMLWAAFRTKHCISENLWGPRKNRTCYTKKRLVNWQRKKWICKLESNLNKIYTYCGKMLMIKVKFFKTSMFGKLALKFIHTSEKH